MRSWHRASDLIFPFLKETGFSSDFSFWNFDNGSARNASETRNINADSDSLPTDGFGPLA